MTSLCSLKRHSVLDESHSRGTERRDSLKVDYDATASVLCCDRQQVTDDCAPVRFSVHAGDHIRARTRIHEVFGVRVYVPRATAIYYECDAAQSGSETASVLPTMSLAMRGILGARVCSQGLRTGLRVPTRWRRQCRRGDWCAVRRWLRGSTREYQRDLENNERNGTVRRSKRRTGDCAQVHQH
eukprot:4416739-Pleurochrysis_carterae.AAC.1